MTTTASEHDATVKPVAGWRARPLLPERLRPENRPRLWLELAFTVCLYLAYSRTRRYVPRHKTAAIHRASEVLHAERLLHVNLELTLNHAVDRVDWLIVGMNYYYATLHFVVTIGRAGLALPPPPGALSLGSYRPVPRQRSSRWRDSRSWPPHRRGSWPARASSTRWSSITRGGPGHPVTSHRCPTSTPRCRPSTSSGRDGAD